MIGGGLKEKKIDERDYKLGAMWDLPRLEDLPREFIVGLPPVLDQGSGTDLCAAAAAHSAAFLHEKTPMAWKWLFAVGKWKEGDVDSFGLELRTAAKVLCKYGIPNESDIPEDFKDKSPEFLRRIENWPEELFDKAIKNRQGSFFDVTGPYDAYDNLKATIFKFASEENAVIFGVKWGWSIDQLIMDSVPEYGSGHALTHIGWREKDGIEYLYIQNSYGEDAGENGRHYFSREVINANIAKYGAIMFHDMTAEDAEYYLQNGIKYNDNWVVAFIKTFVNFFNVKKIRRVSGISFFGKRSS